MVNLKIKRKLFNELEKNEWERLSKCLMPLGMGLGVNRHEKKRETEK